MVLIFVHLALKRLFECFNRLHRHYNVTYSPRQNGIFETEFRVCVKIEALRDGVEIPDTHGDRVLGLGLVHLSPSAVRVLIAGPLLLPSLAHITISKTRFRLFGELYLTCIF